MNIYEKLQEARIKLQSKSLKKTGKNAFAGFEYYELTDILPSINSIMQELKLTSFVNFTSEGATLTIVNSEKPEEVIQFTSPVAEAQLKGCTPIQNLGAVQTYLRRYLYVNAFEIVEHDALDSTQGKEDKKPSTTSSDTPRNSQNNKTNTKTPPNKDVDPDALFCVECEKQIDLKVYNFSKDKYGKALCFNCQKKA